MNEVEFLHKLKLGNERAFGELVQLYQVKVLNICFRFLLNKHDAEDISQDVFVEIFHSIDKFKGESKLSTWIYRIAVTKSLDEIKRRNRKKRISSLGKTLGLEQIAQWLAGKERPDKSMEQNEDYEFLLAKLNALPESQRIAISLSKLEGYSNIEIAEIMETTIVAVDSLIYRAKKQLKTDLNY